MKAIMILFLCFLIIPVFSQEKQHSVFLEAGGNSIFGSWNYDYTLSIYHKIKIVPGAGTSIFPIDRNPLASIILNPAINILIGDKHNLEFGGSCGFNTTFKKAIPGLRLGYRYQPQEGGWMLRIGFTPLFRSNEILPWGGFSFGYTF